MKDIFEIKYIVSSYVLDGDLDKLFGYLQDEGIEASISNKTLSLYIHKNELNLINKLEQILNMVVGILEEIESEVVGCK